LPAAATIRYHAPLIREDKERDVQAKPMWQPSQARAEATQIHGLMQRLNNTHALSLSGYEAMRAWSVEHIAEFWRAVWDDLDIIHSAPPTRIVDDPRALPGATWFEGARLNFSENLLRYRDDRPALVFRGETMTESRTLTYAELYRETAKVAAGLRRFGVKPGDRVVGFLPNMPETVIAMLAAASLGAVWSSCSPDFGVKGVLDRFQRIEPTVLFTADGYTYNGKRFSSLEKVAGIFDALTSRPRVVVVPHLDKRAEIGSVPGAVHYQDFIVQDEALDIDFAQLPFDHPLYIMYSSGTTGLPKCIVQSAGGVLLNQLKEQKYHTDTTRDDNIFYFTTCGWMMWNWLVSALGLGATVTLFDGSPFYPDPSALWRLADQEKISIFGTSAKYIAALEKAGVKPRRDFDLSALKAILSTGSPLTEVSFDYVYTDIKADLCLSSISGGSDLNGCFVGGVPMAPVYRGEIQGRCLGMDVEAYNDKGEPVLNEMGELVCRQAFPSMPLCFWGDEDGSAYHAAYFEEFPGVWHHGDFIEINERGGVRITGRSDATLNPGGVRIGTAEIYRQVEPLDDIEDSLVVGQTWEDDVRVILFVKLRSGRELTRDLAKTIKRNIKENCTPRHVPSKIIAVDDIPYTISGKKVELAVRNLIHGRDVKNRDALKNPEALAHYKNLSELQEP
jgi:acetoacetyl-CoA synthetase